MKKKYILAHAHARFHGLYSQLKTSLLEKDELSVLSDLEITGFDSATLQKLWEGGAFIEDYCLKKNIVLTVPGEKNFPSSLDVPFLYYYGEPVWKAWPCLAVVGSRKPSLESRRWMEIHFTEMLKSVSVAVVSGGARGIDQLAHALSLRVGRPTVCFLPTGFSNIYPRELNQWINDISQSGGAVISQFHPLQELHRGHFHQRNRLIASMSQALFIAEAGRRSGSLMTARWAMELDRDIAVLPHSPIYEGALGGLDLMFDGAYWVRDAEDLKLFVNSSLCLT